MTRVGSDASARTDRKIAALAARWRAAWPTALETWSRYTRLRPPTLCHSTTEAQQHGLSGSFAMIRLADQAVVVSLPEVVRCGVADYALEILAHEIGHHVLAPATLDHHTRMIARMRWALPTVEEQAPMVANLYTDLLINDRLERQEGLRLAEVYRILRGSESSAKRRMKPKKHKRATAKGSEDSPRSAVWSLYLRTYEVLWSLERGTLVPGRLNDAAEGDAWLAARLVRSYAGEWLDGASGFAALLLPYLLGDARLAGRLSAWLDTTSAAAGSDPTGLVEEEPEERQVLHPANDPKLGGDGRPETVPRDSLGERFSRGESSSGQCRQPFEYGEVLRAAGLEFNDHELAVRYYRERARPHLVPFPSLEQPTRGDWVPEGLEPWELGEPLDQIDWLQSLIASPAVIPGLTTLRRVWGRSEGERPERRPLDLDLYVDSSGSMLNPQRQASFPTLAGAIVCLSALRAGARVQATLWSGKHQFTSTDGFVRDEQALLEVLTGYYGGGTAFPIHVLRETFARRSPTARPAHILVISDEGVDTMFARDELGNDGWEVTRQALERARGGGTLVLNLPTNWETAKGWGGALAKIRKARDTHDWNVHRVASWDDLTAFARAFSQLHYGADGAPQAAAPSTGAEMRP